MEDTTQTNREPVVLAEESKNFMSRKWLVLMGAVVIVIMIGAGVYYFTSREQSTTQSFTYLETSPLGEEAKVLKGGALVAPVVGVKGNVSEYVVLKTLQAGLVRTLAATSTEVNTYRAFDTDLYLLGKNSQRITTDGKHKGWLALSGDGTKAAFSFVDSLNPLSEANPAPLDWSVAVVTLATGETKVLGKGVAPKFSPTGDVVVFASVTGLRVYDLATDTLTNVDLPQFASAFGSFDMSPDGKHILVRDSVTGEYTVYALEGTLPELKLSLVGHVPSFITAALSNESVFGLTLSSAGTSEVRSYLLNDLGAEGKLLSTLPEGSSVTRITPQY